MPDLKTPSNRVASKGKGKAKLETHVTAKWWGACVQSDGTHVPHLAHARHHARDTAAEGKDGCHTWRKLRRLVAVTWNVSVHAALVE